MMKALLFNSQSALMFLRAATLVCVTFVIAHLVAWSMPFVYAPMMVVAIMGALTGSFVQVVAFVGSKGLFLWAYRKLRHRVVVFDDMMLQRIGEQSLAEHKAKNSPVVRINVDPDPTEDLEVLQPEALSYIKEEENSQEGVVQTFRKAESNIPDKKKENS
jgi:hypothetical protein